MIKLTSVHKQTTQGPLELSISCIVNYANSLSFKGLCGPVRTDAIWQRNANFGFFCRLTSDPFNYFQIFKNISAGSWSAYLAKFLFVFGFIYVLKLKISRRVAESRPVCVDL